MKEKRAQSRARVPACLLLERDALRCTHNLARVTRVALLLTRPRHTRPAPSIGAHLHPSGLEVAAALGIPISSQETLFSTPEDLDQLEQLLRSHHYPQHRCAPAAGSVAQGPLMMMMISVCHLTRACICLA